MLIVVEYKNGRIKEFDCSVFTSPDCFIKRGSTSRNVATEFDLRLDLLDEEGLRLDIWWHDCASPSGKVTVPDTLDTDGSPAVLDKAARRAGASVTIVNSRLLPFVSRILVYRAGGQVTAAWRQGPGDWLIIGTKFDAQRIQTFTDPRTTSANAQSIAVYRYLRKANPDMSKEEICDLIGYPPGAIDYIMQSEASNIDIVGDADGADGSADAEPHPDPELEIPLDDGSPSAGVDGMEAVERMLDIEDDMEGELPDDDYEAFDGFD